MRSGMQLQSSAKSQPRGKHLSPIHAMLSMLEVQKDAKKLNAIVNHPDVHPWVAGNAEALDFTEAIASEDVICLLAKHGGVMFHRHQPGLFEAHTQVLPAGRGAWGLDCVEACLNFMFSRTDAMEIMTRCPKGNLPAKALARAIGGTHEFTNPNGWIKDGIPVSADIYKLSVTDWMRRAPGLQERGHWFHERLEEELKAFEHPAPQHADDATHDRYVGAACEMFFGGQPEKACVLYNRWACMAGYLPIEVMSTDPLAVDIRSALLVMRDGDFKVVSVAPLH